MDTWAKVLVAVMAALNALYLIFTGYLKSYVEEKAKHLATKEDLRDLVNEVREKAVASKEGEITGIQNKLDIVVQQNELLVTSSETIKTTLSEKTWSKQRHWDWKRDTAVETMIAYGSLLEASANVFKISNDLKRSNFEADREIKEKRGKELSAQYETTQKSFQAAMTAFWQQEEIARLVFSSVVSQKMKIVKDAFNELLVEMLADNRRFNPLFDELRTKQDELSTAMKAELEF